VKAKPNKILQGQSPRPYYSIGKRPKKNNWDRYLGNIFEEKEIGTVTSRVSCDWWDSSLFGNMKGKKTALPGGIRRKDFREKVFKKILRRGLGVKKERWKPSLVCQAPQGRGVINWWNNLGEGKRAWRCQSDFPYGRESWSGVPET